MTRQDRVRRRGPIDGSSRARWPARSAFWVSLCVATMARAEPATSAPAPLGPGEDHEATRAFLSGKEYFDSGRFAEAQEQFQKAFLLTKDPALLYNLGQTYRKLGRCPEAEDAYEQFLRAAPTSPLAERAKKHLAMLRSSCAPAGAPTTGSATPATGVFGDVPPTDAAQTAAPSSPTGSKPPTDSKPPTAPYRTSPIQEARPERRSTSAPDTDATESWQWLPWVTMASGLVAGGTALGLEIYNLPRISQWNTEERSLKRGAAPGESDEAWLARQEANDRLDRSLDSVQTGAIALGIAGAVLVAASGVMFELAPARSSSAHGAQKPPPALELRVTSCDVTPTRVTLSGAF
jgi:tetratricopeptide (TPR) repeat protein